MLHARVILVDEDRQEILFILDDSLELHRLSYSVGPDGDVVLGEGGDEPDMNTFAPLPPSASDPNPSATTTWEDRVGHAPVPASPWPDQASATDQEPPVGQVFVPCPKSPWS